MPTVTYAMWAAGGGLMPLGDQARALLTVALRDPLVVARYRTKMVQVPGSDCLWWRGAVSGRGHGRFHVGTFPAVDGGPRGRDLCLIAHRFGYALVYGAALNEVPVMGHRCDNPICQRIGPGHVQASSHALNRGPICAAVRGGQPVGGRTPADRLRKAGLSDDEISQLTGARTARDAPPFFQPLAQLRAV